MLHKKLVLLFSFIIIVTLTAACSGADKPEAQTPAPDLNQTSWVLSSIETPDGAQFPGVDLRVVTITFQDGNISGSSGCNSFGSTYTTEDGKISVSDQMMQTLMACEEILMNLESAVTQGLMKAESYSVESGQLILTGADYRLVLDPQA